MTERPEWHGKHGHSAYANGACRCEICTKAATKYQRELKKRRVEETARNGLPAHIKHGRSAYCNWGCRCDICNAAQSKSNAAGRARRAKQKQEEAA